MRIYGILAGYADQNDHDVLRYDPVFKLLAGRSPDDQHLASQPTLSRFENAIDIPSLRRLQDVFIDQFIASFSTPPRHLTFDIDVFDDPTHGQQQLTFFHGYYDQYQYLPRVITCKENDLVVMVCLLYGTAHATLGITTSPARTIGKKTSKQPPTNWVDRVAVALLLYSALLRCFSLRSLTRQRTTSLASRWVQASPTIPAAWI